MAKGNRGGKYGSKTTQSLSLTGQAIKYKLEQEGFTVNSDNTVTLYHMTPPENVNSIIANGFKGNYDPIGGGVGGANVGERSFFSLDKNWVQNWDGGGYQLMTIRVPVEYIRQGARNKYEVYLEGTVKKKGNKWIPDRQPTSTFYDRIAVKEYNRAKGK